MKKSLFVMLVFVVLSALILAACGGGQPSGSGAAKPAAPAPYAGKTNPLKGDAAAATAGKATYTQYCATCHGDTGMGDGPAGVSLTPPPAKLAEVVKTDKEDYMFWRINEGGAMAPFNSSMPAQKGVLSEEEIWQVITYVQSLAK